MCLFSSFSLLFSVYTPEFELFSPMSESKLFSLAWIKISHVGRTIQNYLYWLDWGAGVQNMFWMLLIIQDRYAVNFKPVELETGSNR